MKNDWTSTSGPFDRYQIDGFVDYQAPDIAAWKLARSAIEHENNLINHRLTWFLSSQAFLLTAFFVVLSASDKPILKELEQLKVIPLLLFVIGFLAIYMCLVTKAGIDRASIALDQVTGHFSRLAMAHGFSDVGATRTPPLHVWLKVGLFDVSHLPMVTGIMWVTLEVVCALTRTHTVRDILAHFTYEQAMQVVGLMAALIGVAALSYSRGVSRTANRQHTKPLP